MTSRIKRTRETARKAGEHLYKTGAPCVHGHIAPRYTSTTKCTQCVLGKGASWYARNRVSVNQKVMARRKSMGAAYLVERRKAAWKYQGLPIPTRPAPALCELCGKANRSGKALSLDHDHPTNKFRGWLCHRCNLSLGYFGDSIQGLERAIAYLKRAEENDSEITKVGGSS